MKIRKSIGQILCALLLAFNLCACAQAQDATTSVAASERASDAADPREWLAKQPDFVAEEIYFSTEKRGEMGFVSGHQLLFKKAKQGEYYRSDTGFVVIYFDAENRTFDFNPKSKKWEEQPERSANKEWYDGAENPPYFAGKQGVKYEILGTEKVAEHDCLKIKATKEGAPPKGEDEEEAVYFYVAKEMRNLVIATRIFLPRRRTSYVLRNISFNVPDKLFKEILNRN